MQIKFFHKANADHPPVADAVPNRDSHWIYNTLRGVLARDQFTMCLLTGLNKITLKPVNYDKLLDIIQDRNKKSISVPPIPQKDSLEVH